MMVCTNCGFHNEAKTEFCKKCGNPLVELPSTEKEEEHPDSLFQIHGEIPKEEGEHFFGENSLRWTKPKPESDLSEDLMSEDPTKAAEETKAASFSCPSCWHTPLAFLPDLDHPCPNCGYKGISNPPIQKAPNPRHTVVMHELDIEQVEPEFRLINERKQQDLRFTGNSVVLRRDNLDPENRSISSRGHARISRENGQWYVEDESSNRATFIQVKGKVPIQAGDQIILGNKIFRFEIE